MLALQNALRGDEQRLDGLSSKTGIPVGRLHELANGADPTMREVRSLAGVLKLAIPDLAPLSKETERAEILFREMAHRKHIPAAALVETLSQRMAYSLELLHQAKSVPWWAKEFRSLPQGNPEAFAMHFRSFFCNGDSVSPLLSLPGLLLERLQLMLHVVNTPHFEGASAYVDGIPFIFVSARFPPRMLFTCAHELGHLLAHHDPEADFATIDSSTDLQEHHSHSVSERFAHAFASALLIPPAGLGIVLKKIRQLANIPEQSPLGDVEMLYVSRVFGVSFEVAARRCEDLDLLPRGGAVSLNNTLKEMYGSAEKRAEMLHLPPRPVISFPPLPLTLVNSAVERIRKGEVSIGRASMMLGLSIKDLLTANSTQLQ